MGTQDTHYAFGVDIGGTRTKTGLVDTGRGEIIGSEVAMTVTDDASRFIEVLGESAERVLRDTGVRFSDIAGIGIGVPGYVDVDTGVVDTTFGFLPFMENYYLKRIVEERLGLPCRLDNDARVVALGEARFGAGIGSHRLLVLTLGTGVGVGVIIDGGFINTSPLEHMAGHVPFSGSGRECYCGVPGCFESCVCADGIIWALKDKLRAGGISRFSPDDSVTTEEIFRAAAEGDYAATGVVEKVLTDIARGINGYVHLFAPDTVVIGGGISRGLIPYLERIGENIVAKPMRDYTVKILVSDLQEHAGILGAAALFTAP